MAKMLFRLPKAAKVFENPSADEVKELAAKMPNAKPTRHGNLNVQTDVVSRSKPSSSSEPSPGRSGRGSSSAPAARLRGAATRRLPGSSHPKSFRWHW